jgi:hypothetical protein
VTNTVAYNDAELITDVIKFIEHASDQLKTPKSINFFQQKQSKKISGGVHYKTFHNRNQLYTVIS